MGLENINYNEVINNKIKKCEFCGRELEPIGFDYLYVNISPDCIDYKRCTCDKAQEYWKEKDKKEYEEQNPARCHHGPALHKRLPTGDVRRQMQQRPFQRGIGATSP